MMKEMGGEEDERDRKRNRERWKGKPGNLKNG